MLNFKRIILVALLVLSLFAFAGCSSKTDEEVKGVTDSNEMYDDSKTDGGRTDDSLKDDLNDVKNDAEDMMDMDTDNRNATDNNGTEMTTDSGMNN